MGEVRIQSQGLLGGGVEVEGYSGEKRCEYGDERIGNAMVLEIG